MERIKHNGQIAASVFILVIVFHLHAISITSVFKGELTGIVKDSLSGEGLPFASLQLFSVPDNKMINGTITNDNGIFKISSIEEGTYRIEASYMGYHPGEMQIHFTGGKDFLEILMKPNIITLAGVEITGKRKLVEGKIDKTVINVSKNSTLSAGTALDALKTAPSVDVDFDGNIRYRGSDQVMVLVNGEKSGMVKSLSQIPSDAVEKIEIISNPAARYEAQGMSGIINIVLKSGQGSQKNKTLVLNMGDHQLYGGTAGFTRTSGKVMFFVNAGAGHKRIDQLKKHHRLNDGNPLAPDYSQIDTQEETQKNGFVNSSLSYKINEKNSIGVSAVLSKANQYADRLIHYRTIAKTNAIVQESDKTIGISLDNQAIDGDVTYRLNFNKSGQQMKVFAKYSGFSQEQDMENHHDYPLFQKLQNTRAAQLNSEGQGTVEYFHPLNSLMVFNGGYSHIRQNIQNRFSSESYDNTSSTWKPDRSLENDFRYIQHINAFFFEMNIKKEVWESRLGLRAEHTYTSQNDRNGQCYLSLFPSFNLSGKVNNNHTIYLAYNRRLNRPGIRMLNPYSDEYADELNIHKGNPALKPEFVNSLGLGDRFSGEKWSGSGELYFRYIGQAISRIKTATNDSALVVTYMNLSNASLYGCDFVCSFQPFPWWEMTASANVFHTALAGQTGTNTIDGGRFSCEGNIHTLFRLPKGYTVSIAAYYRSKLPSVLGIYKERYYTDWAVSKKVMKGKGQLVLKIHDVFDTYLFGLDLRAFDDRDLEYTQSNRRKIHSEWAAFSFTYNINGKGQSPKPGKENFFLDGFEK